MASWTFRQLATLQGCSFLPGRVRGRLLRMAGISVHPTAFIAERVAFGGDKVSVGEHSFINVAAYVEGTAPTDIGKNVLIGPYSKLLTSSHEVGSCDRRGGKDTRGTINIGDGTWIGAGATILPGITVASGCVIAAGAVVVNSTEPNGLYAGVPARRMRTLAQHRTSPEL